MNRKEAICTDDWIDGNKVSGSMHHYKSSLNVCRPPSPPHPCQTAFWNMDHLVLFNSHVNAIIQNFRHLVSIGRFSS